MIFYFLENCKLYSISLSVRITVLCIDGCFKMQVHMSLGVLSDQSKSSTYIECAERKEHSVNVKLASTMHCYPTDRYSLVCTSHK